MTAAERFLRASGVLETEFPFWLDQMQADGLATRESIPLVQTEKLLPWLIGRSWYGVFDAPSEFDAVRSRWLELISAVNSLAHSDEQPLAGLARLDAHRAPVVEWAGRTGGTFAEIALTMADEVTDCVVSKSGESTWGTLRRIAIRDVVRMDHLPLPLLLEQLSGEWRRMETVVRGWRRREVPSTGSIDVPQQLLEQARDVCSRNGNIKIGDLSRKLRAAGHKVPGNVQKKLADSLRSEGLLKSTARQRRS